MNGLSLGVPPVLPTDNAFACPRVSQNVWNLSTLVVTVTEWTVFPLTPSPRPDPTPARRA